MKHKECLILVVISLLLMTCGCVAPFGGKPIIRKYRRVAVMPFDNVTQQPGAAESMTNIFFSRLHLSGTFEIVEMGEVNEFILRQRIRQTGEISRENASKMREELGVDAIILGSVNEYVPAKNAVDKIPQLGVSVRMLDAEDAYVVWARSIAKQGNDVSLPFDIGRVTSVNRLAGWASKSLVKDLRRYRWIIRPAPEVIVEKIEKAANGKKANGAAKEPVDKDKDKIREKAKKEWERIKSSGQGEE